MEIFTIGYGEMELRKFLSELKELGIEVVADIRSFPTSKYPEFSRESLEKSLKQKGIEYLHLKELGGMRGGYREHMESREFQRGIEKLLGLAEGRKVALMCLEVSPGGCHRKYVAEHLESKGVDVRHIVRGKVR